MADHGAAIMQCLPLVSNLDLLLGRGAYALLEGVGGLLCQLLLALVAFICLHHDLAGLAVVVDFCLLPHSCF